MRRLEFAKRNLRNRERHALNGTCRVVTRNNARYACRRRKAGLAVIFVRARRLQPAVRQNAYKICGIKLLKLFKPVYCNNICCIDLPRLRLYCAAERKRKQPHRCQKNGNWLVKNRSCSNALHIYMISRPKHIIP